MVLSVGSMFLDELSEKFIVVLFIVLRIMLAKLIMMMTMMAMEMSPPAKVRYSVYFSYLSI